MGRPVVHFEIEGRDGRGLQGFSSKMFEWQFVPALINADYGLVARETNLSTEGVGIGGAVNAVPEKPSTTRRGQTRDEGYEGHVTFYVDVPDVEAALALAERLGGKRMQGPDDVGQGRSMGKFTDPEGHLIGVVSHTKS